MYEEQKKDKGVKGLKIGLIIIFIAVILLIIIAVGIFLYINELNKEQLKVSIDEIYNSQLSINTNAFLDEQGKMYISINDIGKHLGYNVYNGEYGKYTEDKSNCYATNKKELVTFSAGSNKIRKYSQLKNAESQEFELEEPIIERANSLYISSEDMTRAFNTVVEFNEQNNSVRFTTLSYLTTQYKKVVKNAFLENSDSSNLDNSIIFSNQKALLENLVVIQDSTTSLLGVGKYDNNEVSTIITPRYKSIEFIEGICDFIVQTTDNKYGVIDKEGVTKVKPGFDEIKEIEKDLGLYLVISNNKPGIINQNGKTIVHQDYDAIGLSSNMGDSNVKNKYLLYGNCIPVCLNKKWGLVDLNGNTILNLEYDGIGCALQNVQTNTSGVVLIPDLNGIVVEKDTKTENSTIKKYGIVDATGSLIVNVVADSIYTTTLADKTTYYVEANKQKVDIVYYWNEEKQKIEQQNNEQQEQSAQQNQVEQPAQTEQVEQQLLEQNTHN